MAKMVPGLVFAAALATTGAALAAAPACPVSDADSARVGTYVAAVGEAIDKAPNCQRAFRILELCQLGSSGDNALSDAARRKCEPLFHDRLDAAGKNAWRKAVARCDKLAENNPGSLYQSFAALCLARAARDFAGKFGRRE